MLAMPVLNLFLYNVLVSYIDWQCRDAIDAITPTAVFWPNISFWHQLPIVSKILSFLFGLEERIQQLSDAIWFVNPYFNALLLLPAVFQHDVLQMLLAVIIMWNVGVSQRMLSFFVGLMWKLWASNLCWGYYILLASFGVLMNGIHFMLISGTIKLPQVQVLRRID